MSKINVINGIDEICQIEEEQYVFVFRKHSLSLKFWRNYLFFNAGIVIAFSLFHFSIGISVFTIKEGELYDNGHYYIELIHLVIGIFLMLSGIFMANYARIRSTDNLILKKKILKITYMNGLSCPKFEILYRNKNGKKRIRSIWLRKDSDELEKAKEIMAIEKMYYQ
jgi:hypothetical protein